MRHLTQADVASAIHRYQDGESSTALGQSFGVSNVAILKHLRNHGVERRTRGIARRVYPIWDAAFSRLTPESAYWIGFLMADGCVIDASKVALQLKKSDVAHLRKFRAFLRTSPRPIRIVPQNASCYIKIHSRQIVEDLATYGVVPRKSLIAVARGGIEHREAFWLGVFDGDGTINLRRSGLVRVDGTRMLMTQFANFVANARIDGHTNRVLRPAVYKIANGLYSVSLTGQRAANFLRLVYSASPVSLNRKRAIAKRLMATRSS